MPDFLELVKALKAAADDLATEGLTDHQRKKIRQHIDDLIEGLTKLTRKLDPIQMPDYVLDPASPEEIGRFIATAMMERPKVKLNEVGKYYGSGIYAIYYVGGFKAYAPISKTDHPIYVGKADPQEGGAKTPLEQGVKLSARLAEHLKSIRCAAKSLKEDDFECRYLVVTSNWQSAAEKILINLYKPIWNNEVKICFGLGKHGDSSKTRDNARSPWDTLHPGREWASHAGVKPYKLSVKEIEGQIAAHYAENPPIKSLEVAIKKTWS